MHMPLYSHPSQTVLVDDNQSFLRSLAFQLDPVHPCITFHDAELALDWIRRHSPCRVLARQKNDDIRDKLAAGFNLERIARIACEPRRFTTPSVLVVDYAMPQMNGLEFCERVRDLPCKKIMLTGQADEKMAAKDLNTGLIDRFIQKSDARALDLLELNVATLQCHYFDEGSQPLRGLAMSENYQFLYDPAVVAQAKRLMDQHGFIEHYIFSRRGGNSFPGQVWQHQVDDARHRRQHAAMPPQQDAYYSRQAVVLLGIARGAQ